MAGSAHDIRRPDQWQHMAEEDKGLPHGVGHKGGRSRETTSAVNRFLVLKVCMLLWEVGEGASNGFSSS